MKDLATFFGKTPRKRYNYESVGWVLPHQLIGIEIEVENHKGVLFPTETFPYWRQERDGSLRNGVEFVLEKPLKGDPLREAIHMIFAGSRFTRSTTGSTHIHVDMFEEGVTQETVKALVLLIYALEPAIFAIADKGREWCGYTNKLASGPDELVASVLNSTDNDYQELLSLCNNNYQTGRYYGANLLALAKYGSIEFRYFPTCVSAAELTDWVQLVQSFKKAAIEIGGVAGVNRVFSSVEQYNAFIKAYFGPWQEKFFEEVPQFTAMQSFHKALGVASSYAIGRNTPIEPFNEEAVLGNPVLMAKFANKKAKPVAPARFLYDSSRYQLGHDQPHAADHPAGTVMQSGSNTYIGDGSMWRSIPSSHVDRMPMTPRRAALRAMQDVAARGNIQEQLRSIGLNNRDRGAMAEANLHVAIAALQRSITTGSSATPPVRATVQPRLRSRPVSQPMYFLDEAGRAQPTSDPQERPYEVDYENMRNEVLSAAPPTPNPWALAPEQGNNEESN